MSAERMPPRLSTGSVASFTWLGTNLSARRSATTASGRVTRNTDPHQKCSSSAPAISGPSAEIAAADRRPQRDRLRPRLPGPERGDERERGGVCHAGGEPAEDAGQRRARRRWVRRRRAGMPGSTAAVPSDEHHLAPVPVAEGAEVEDRRREAERVPDRDQVERRLRRVERLADVGERDVRDREVQVGDRGDEDQRDQDQRAALRRMVRLCPAGLPRRGPAPGLGHERTLPGFICRCVHPAIADLRSAA